MCAFDDPGGAMSFHQSVQRTLEYNLVRYGASRISFRGPQKPLCGRYIAFLGGSETFGKFVKSPFPELVEAKLETTCVNLGYMNAGVDAFLHEAEILSIAARSEFTVVQVMGAQNMSNRLYRVHPRRNDRFLSASDLMQRVFPEVDFTEYNFTRHMLLDIATQANDRFSFITSELRAAWMSRMQHLLGLLPGKKALLWFSEQTPPVRVQGVPDKDPWFIDQGMIEGLKNHVDVIIQIDLSDAALDEGSGGKYFTPMEWSAAQRMFGPRAHAEAADAISNALLPLLAQKNRPRDGGLS